MASLSEIRSKYPEYGYLSDPELADAMHKKFYADMPREEFDKRVGLRQTTKPEMTTGEVAADVAKSAGIGLVQGGIGMATLELMLLLAWWALNHLYPVKPSSPPTAIGREQSSSARESSTSPKRPWASMLEQLENSHHSP